MTMPNRMPRRAVLLGIASAGALVGAAIGMRRMFPYFALDPAVREIRSRARPHVEKADADSLAGIAASLRSLDHFFDEAKGHAAAFADDVLGWYSKYKLIRGQHEEFLAETFRQHFFGPQELEQAMTNAVEAYVADLEAIDNRMLVEIRLDVADLPAGARLATLPEPDLRKRFRAVSDRISGIAGNDAAMDLGRAAADMIVGSVIAMMAARLGTSAVVLGAGAATSWWTFGIGLVIGLIVDQIIAAVWDWTYDPRGKLVVMMETKIDEIRQLVVDGEDGKPGLRQELRRYAERRAIVRREAVLQLLAGT